MSEKTILIPNRQDSFIVEELRSRLEQGLTVTMAFTGNSMLPTIDGTRDKVLFRPVDTSKLKVGDVCLFLYRGLCVVHRLLRIEGDKYVFRGDNCVDTQTVGRDDLLAILVAVQHPDGTLVSCDSAAWRRQSRRVVAWRSTVNLMKRLFCRRQRRWERWVYFVCLLLLMWAPVGVLGVPLNNFVFGIRLDHLLHASVYIPCTLFMFDFFRNSRRPLLLSWLVAILLCVTTETVQYFLPYRGFDINDMAANVLGVSLGAVVMKSLLGKRLKSK